jgi:hypothetical protein
MVIAGTVDPNYFYKNYVEYCIRNNKPYGTKEEFLKVIKQYTNVMAGVLITEGRVTFPGTIFTIDLAREKKRVVDITTVKQWGKSNIPVFNFNEHTFGYSASFGINDHGLKKAKPYKFYKSTKLKNALIKFLKSDPRNILKYRIKNPRKDDQ